MRPEPGRLQRHPLLPPHQHPGGLTPPPPGPPLAIEPITLASHLDHTKFITRLNDHEVKVSEFHQWAGKLETNVGEVIRENLASLLAGRDVFTLPAPRPKPYTLRLEVELIRFEPNTQGHVELTARWRLFKGTEQRANTRTTLHQDTLPPNSPSTLVEAMSQLLHKLSQEIAAAVNQD